MKNQFRNSSVYLVILSAVLLFPVESANASGTPLDSEESAFLTLINNYRAQNGAGPLQVSDTLRQSSFWMSTDMAMKNYFSHTDSLGRDPGTRLAAFGYSYFPWGENIAAGNSDAQNAFNQWLNACDPGANGNCTYAHRLNMLNSSYKAIGIGRAYNSGSTYKWYWTTDFGGVVDQVLNPNPTTAPVISSFVASPAAIMAGQPTSLSWSVTGASAISIDNGIGDVSTLASKTVAPPQTTTYRLTATNSAGSVTAAFTVTVNLLAQPPAMGNCNVFPADNIWNTAIDQLPVSQNSSTYISTIGARASMHADFGSGLYAGGPIGIPYITVTATQAKYPATFFYFAESDPGPYAVPLDAPIEGGSLSSGDRHVIAVEVDNCVLYEFGKAYPQISSWNADAGAISNLRSNALRPSGWTSTDAAGLPILAGLVRYEEIAAGAIRHALRFTAPQTQHAFVWPARHYASSITDPAFPPMGLRVRLRGSYDISSFSATNQIILRALKKYGMMLSDNGSPWYVTGAPDPRWDNNDLHQLDIIAGSDFEVVDVSTLMLDPDSGRVRQIAPAITVSKAHSGNFTQGQTGTTYTVTVSNGSGALPTSGTVTVIETLPAGLSLVSMAGTGWTCPAGGTTCTRSDALAGGASYPAITVTVNVALNAAAQVTNQVSTSGGGSTAAVASDVTTIVPQSLPTVHIETPSPGATVSGVVTVAGWAVDNATAVGTSFSSVLIKVDGNFVANVNYGLSRADVCSAYPGRPGCPNVGFSYALNTASLTPGSHIITVSATDTDIIPDVGSHSVTVTVSGSSAPPTAWIETPSQGATVSGVVTVAGWAIDNASAIGTAISSVQVKVDGTTVGTATYGSFRPDVCNSYPGRPGCPNVGYGFALNTSSLTPGSHTITFSATDTDAIPSVGSYSVTVTVSGSSAPPTAWIETPSQGATVSGVLTVAGWAIDNASAVGTAISSVQVKVDGTTAGTATYGSFRPDVCNSYPGRPGCPNVGYSFALNTSSLTPGSHTITVSATDTDQAPSVGTYSVTVTVSGSNSPPTAWIETPSQGATISGVVTIGGWAIDNASAVGTAISSVQVKVDGVNVGTATYGSFRPDVCGVYPGRPGCPNVGYSFALNTASLSPGSHTITVVATDGDTSPDSGSFSIIVNK